jgi:hypothetical protein
MPLLTRGFPLVFHTFLILIQQLVVIFFPVVILFVHLLFELEWGQLCQ